LFQVTVIQNSKRNEVWRNVTSVALRHLFIYL